MVKISPSILSCDFANMKDDIATIVNDVEYLHIDVMDGVFVNNISIGIPVVKALRPHFDVVFDVHLMIVEPEKYIKQFVDAGADIITFHYEATKDPEALIDLIHSYGVKAGISIKPKTEPSVLYRLLKKLDLILIMSVEPGFGGQLFDQSAINKIAFLREEKDVFGYTYEIEVDGGINNLTGKECVEAGADVLVSGSYIFKASDRLAAINSLRV
jgi:ribulose-phosphate 3-epimerase